MRVPIASAIVAACAVAVLAISPSRSDAQSTGAPPAPCWPVVTDQAVYAAGERCLPVWIDSLRSPIALTSARARYALSLTGGRAAFDALRADYARAPSLASRYAAITAVATTGSTEDIAFLMTQLQGPFTGNPDSWPTIQAAATTLGLLRATAARDSLQTALARNGLSGFAGRAVAWALASLDRPPCADSIAGDPNRELVRIVMQCGPQSMSTTSRYQDTSAGGVWSFVNGAWRSGPRTAADIDSLPSVTAGAIISPDGRHASVSVSTWCGLRCGEGWTFTLMLIGGLWRVVSAGMNWIS